VAAWAAFRTNLFTPPYNDLGGLPDNLVDLFTPPYNDGARIHTNSWGGPTGGTQQNPEYGGYTIYSRQADTMMWQHQDMLILFAAWRLHHLLSTGRYDDVAAPGHAHPVCSRQRGCG